MSGLSENTAKILQNCAVGVSGGRDSMALCHMLHAAGIGFTALTVDHALRTESRAEAETVGLRLKEWNIPHHILTWVGEKPETGIMEAAREARYRLLTDYCRENNIETLAIAHQADDQIETFLYRLTRGSGLDGLSGMSETAKVNGIKLVRPLLTMTRRQITDYCAENNISYVDDPSNENDHYTRVRFRQFLESEGLNADRLSRTISRLSRASDALDAVADAAYAASVTGSGSNGINIDYNAWKGFHSEIRIRIMQRIIREITGDFFAGKLAAIESGIEIIAGLDNGKSYASGGVMFTRKNTGIKAVRETRRD